MIEVFDLFLLFALIVQTKANHFHTLPFQHWFPLLYCFPMTAKLIVGNLFSNEATIKFNDNDTDSQTVATPTHLDIMIITSFRKFTLAKISSVGIWVSEIADDTHSKR